MAAGPAFTGLAARADSPDTAFSNPAGMSRLEAGGFTVEGILARGLGEFRVDEAVTSMEGGDPNNDSSPVLVPFLYYVRPMGEDWHAGFSLTVPTGFGSDYGGSWAGRYYSDAYSLVYVSLTAALSRQIDDRVSVGAAINVNYTRSESEVAIRNLAPDVPDGRLRSELDGIGVSLTLSVLWQATERMRLGLVYTSAADAELEGDLEFSNLGPVLGPLLESQGLVGADLEISNTLPQRVVAGLYRELSAGRFVTADVLWTEFSEFGASSVALNGSDLDIGGSDSFEDLFGISLGFGVRTAGGRTWTLGVFHLTSPVDDDDRGLALALDRVWAVGAGVNQSLSLGRAIDFNVNLVDYGESPVDTGSGIYRGRIAGKTDNPYALVVDVAYHF